MQGRTYFAPVTELDRRDALVALALTSAAAATSVGCARKEADHGSAADKGASDQNRATMKNSETNSSPPENESAVLEKFPLGKGRPWPTPDPFLFCVHHNDKFPRGNGQFGPPEGALVGRQIGMDFAWKDGWNMYHGERVPGFPSHPHRGFETVTVVRSGRLDHADSLGAAARYGDGDVQWLTAGAGIQHAEMFPLLKTEEENPLDLFQIWLNLPARSKMAAPYFTMLWADQIPTKVFVDKAGKKTSVSIRAGEIEGAKPPAAPPDSWAHDPENEVAIWTAELEPGATWTLPLASSSAHRFLYFFEGQALEVAGEVLAPLQGAALQAHLPTQLSNLGSTKAEILVLQGRPIGEPVAQQGPFVMNTQEEVRQAFADYRRTQFGGWPWPDSGPVHGHDQTRFARDPSGKIERPGGQSG